MAVTPQDQKAYWNGPAGEIWTEAQVYMDRMLAPLSAVAVGRAAVVEGEQFVDIGCGCGDTTLALAASGATAWGVDISAPMVAHARTRAAGRANVTFTVADAATQQFAADHQLVFSRFGVMFFDDPAAAFTNIRTALGPDGRLLFLCWQAPQKNLWASLGAQALRPYLPPAEPPDPRAPGPFAFADPQWIREILGTAGFTAIDLASLTPDLHVGDTIDEAMYLQGRVGPAARLLAELDEATRTQALAAVRTALEPYERADGVHLPSAAWLVQARNRAS